MAIDHKALELKIRQIIADHTEPRGKKDPLKKVTLKANLYNDLGIDSLNRVEVLLVIEKEFHIEIPEEVSNGWKTVNDFITGTQPFLKLT